MNKALFLDRDGTIIEHVHYINDPEKVILKEGISERMLEFQKMGYLLIVVTNQAGIARGEITPTQYEDVNKKMLELLAEKGVIITDVFHCPSHPDDNDPRRKPGPGMILEAAKKYGIDLASSIIVGDSEKDLEAGKRAGVGTRLHVDEFLKIR